MDFKAEIDKLNLQIMNLKGEVASLKTVADKQTRDKILKSKYYSDKYRNDSDYRERIKTNAKKAYLKKKEQNNI